jgi:small subunit ribosomal protein S6
MENHFRLNEDVIRFLLFRLKPSEVKELKAKLEAKEEKAEAAANENKGEE